MKVAAAVGLGASGATAVVASGLFLGEDVRRSSGGIVHERLRNVWSDFSFITRNIIFLVLGAGFSFAALTSVWPEAIMIIVLLFAVIRPASVYLAAFFKKTV